MMLCWNCAFATVATGEGECGLPAPLSRERAMGPRIFRCGTSMHVLPMVCFGVESPQQGTAWGWATWEGSASSNGLVGSVEGNSIEAIHRSRSWLIPRTAAIGIGISSGLFPKCQRGATYDTIVHFFALNGAHAVHIGPHANSSFSSLLISFSANHNIIASPFPPLLLLVLPGIAPVGLAWGHPCWW